MDLLDRICEELGVEIGDSWVGNAGKRYKINEYGQVKVWNDEYDEWIESYYNLGHVINGDLKPPKWKPKYGEEYQTPELDNYLKFSSHTWYNGERDNLLMRRGLVFKTTEDAIEVANKMLEILEEE